MDYGRMPAGQKHKPLSRHPFSHNAVNAQEARLALETRYERFLLETDEFNRRLVSFQANKMEVLHGWMKYREGFSAVLVERLISEFELDSGNTLLDPFAGSCTTLLVARLLGINASGIEMLPHCHLAWEAKSRAFQYDVPELRYIHGLLQTVKLPAPKAPFPHLEITKSAFPERTEWELMAFTGWLETLAVSEDAKILCRFVLTSILEEISYTRKDGQYLRWDSRAAKIERRNQQRQAEGKKPIVGIYKGELPGVREAFVKKLGQIIVDVVRLQRELPPSSSQRLYRGSTLYLLPQLEPEQFDAVITSPPYANRYDYTRTYALELAYLGVGRDIFSLRQDQLSCTVENKTKLEQLRTFYHAIGQEGRFASIVERVKQNEALAEINSALEARYERGEINNRGVLPMIAQYFTELSFVMAELYRTCRRGARVAFVNDNVRYAGEVIPVDTISTNLAEQFGFEPQVIYVLPQRKGNSSQQMERYGRMPLRKSITIWRRC